MFDLILKNGLIVDPLNGTNEVGDLAVKEGKIEMIGHDLSNAKEIDVIVEENGMIHPLEIKKSANPDRRGVKKYQVLSPYDGIGGCNYLPRYGRPPRRSAENHETKWGRYYLWYCGSLRPQFDAWKCEPER